MNEEVFAVSKKQIAVEIALTTGVELKGFLFVREGERLQDLLNDDRSFLPLEETPDNVTIIQKSSIANARAVSGAITRAADIPNYGFGPDPMGPKEALRILGLDTGCGETQINDAFHRIMLSVHPDQGGSNYLAAKVNSARDVLLRQIQKGTTSPDKHADNDEPVSWGFKKSDKL
ncbi:hypothetical protein GCM10017044_14190 [Kordiimonas sediminis]|uniref:J domain-containing protein n=1 Tax=Kordiimonas sediminis TaxID=1735581 RepID=A0A919E7A6_9PROT|nr:hypothetical protein [Kordiimonas sediminis]GHF20485.1 hypothetical protein GCM10017044_14190 [Kordiimonas sediminis]